MSRVSTFSQEKRCLISIAIFLIIQGRAAEEIFVDKQSHYDAKLFSMIIYPCWLLNISSFFLSLPIGPPLATTLLNLCLKIDKNYSLM